MEMFRDPLIGAWDAVQVIYEVAMHEGFELDLKLSEVEGLEKNTAWRVANRAGDQEFLICLDASLDAGIAEALGLSVDNLFICRDAALTDTLAANLALQCRLRTL
jgi:adenine-specific DNA-methyltransferase